MDEETVFLVSGIPIESAPGLRRDATAPGYAGRKTQLATDVEEPARHSTGYHQSLDTCSVQLHQLTGHRPAQADAQRTLCLGGLPPRHDRPAGIVRRLAAR